jgi:small subunit ribosomal protein S17
VNERKTREAVVISDKMQKTRVVRIERVHRHPRYERVVRSSKRLKVHDEANTSKVGDRVVIEETRPLSKEKRWRIRQIVKKADATVSNRPPDGAAPASSRPPSVQAG